MKPYLQPGARVVGPEAAPVETQTAAASGPRGPVPQVIGAFAQQAATSIPGIRNWRLTMSEPVRINGAPGYETRLEATTGKDNTPVTVVQWLRFGNGPTSLRVIGTAPTDQWPAAFTRFRAVRDGIQ